MTAETPAARGLAARIAASHLAMRDETRRLIDGRQSEGRLLAIAMLSGLVWYFGSIGVLWLDPQSVSRPPEEMLGRIGTEFASALIFRTLGLYLFAGVLFLAARGAGGSGDGNATRTGFFWAALVAAPAMLVTRLAGAWIGGPGLSGAAIETIGTLFFAWLTAQGLAEAHRFRRPLAVFFTLIGCAVVLAVAVNGLFLR